MKISAPTKDEEFPARAKELQELKDALIYWGKIIERQNKIKFIRNSHRLQALEEFKAIANDEMQYINQEKEKVLSENSDIGINFEMLKTAQAIDREVVRAKKIWTEDSDEAEDSDEIATKKTTKARNIRQVKFRDIAKANEAFPTLGDGADADSLMDDTAGPVGEINE